MGVASIAELIRGTTEEAQELLDSFFKSFPKVKSWMDETEKFAKKYGYVEDWYGRRRRLPDILLPAYEVKYLDNSKNNVETFNPFLHCSDRIIEDKLLDKYKSECKKIKSRKDFDTLRQQAQKDGIAVLSNTSLISQAERQSVNARVQGGSATMTKIAMIKIANDEELNKYGFKMLIGVHDELIGECPKEYAEQVAERLSYVMRTCIEDYCVVPFKCDADICTHWYLNEYESSVSKEYSELVKKYDGDCDKALKDIINSHSESTEEFIKSFLKVDINQ